MGNGGPITRTASPLLTDEATARSLGLPHTRIANNIAMVPAASVAMEPGVTVVPGAATVASKSAREGAIAPEYARRGDLAVMGNR
jgi:hypothetical protein